MLIIPVALTTIGKRNRRTYERIYWGQSLDFSLYVSFLNGSVEETGAILTGAERTEVLMNEYAGVKPWIFLYMYPF